MTQTLWAQVHISWQHLPHHLVVCRYALLCDVKAHACMYGSFQLPGISPTVWRYLAYSETT